MSCYIPITHYVSSSSGRPTKIAIILLVHVSSDVAEIADSA
jgi:hypothetical protein